MGKRSLRAASAATRSTPRPRNAARGSPQAGRPEPERSPRFHMQRLPCRIRAEAGIGLGNDAIRELDGMGNKLLPEGNMGDVNALHIDANGRISASHETRHEY